MFTLKVMTLPPSMCATDLSAFEQGRQSIIAAGPDYMFVDRIAIDAFRRLMTERTERRKHATQETMGLSTVVFDFDRSLTRKLMMNAVQKGFADDIVVIGREQTQFGLKGFDFFRDHQNQISVEDAFRKLVFIDLPKNFHGNEAIEVAREIKKAFMAYALNRSMRGDDRWQQVLFAANYEHLATSGEVADEYIYALAPSLRFGYCVSVSKEDMLKNIFGCVPPAYQKLC